MIHAFIKKGSFQDSVSLMLISKQLSQLADVEEVSVMMGTPANQSLLAATGFWHEMFETATPNDICVAIKTDNRDEQVITMVSDALAEALTQIAQRQQGGKRLLKARRWESAQQKLPSANLALISIAGEYAANVAHQALDDGKNVMIFSDNVSLNDEVALKTKAASRNLIVMGPDCGTAILAGAPLAFSNVIPAGSIGVIGASGTGIQEVISQIALLGQGITQAIGLGGRDLSADVGGISAFTALKWLAADPNSHVLTFVSKPPADSVRSKMIAAMKQIPKPIVALFLGARVEHSRDHNIYFANTLDEAARLSVQLANVIQIAQTLPKVAQKKIIGLYTGGTLAAEAAMLLADQLDQKTDAKHEKGTMLNADGHLILDLGDDFYTVGKPHPMIDPSTRIQAIAELGDKPEIGVLLADVVIGYGANGDPAASLIEGVAKAKLARDVKNPLIVIATVTGSEHDPQGRSAQIQALTDAGIVVMNALPDAILLAMQLITPETPAASTAVPSLLTDIGVINIGLRSFAEDLQSASIPVVQYQWAPIAGGNAALAAMLKKLH